MLVKATTRQQNNLIYLIYTYMIIKWMDISYWQRRSEVQVRSRALRVWERAWQQQQYSATASLRHLLANFLPAL